MDCCALLHDFINTITYSAPTGLAGGERSELPGRRGTTIRTPAGVAGSPRTPAAAGANSCCTIPGVRFRSPPAKALAKGPSGNKVYILLLASRPAGKARATSIPAVRSEQHSQRACGPQPAGARRRAGICFVAAPRRCPTSPSSRRLASARPALAPKCTPYFLTGPKLPVPFQGARAYLGKYVGAFMKSCAE